MKGELKEDILLVDDNAENLKVLGTFLRPRGYKIRIAKNGQKALESINQKHPKVILLDAQMPVMDGFETCKALKKEPSTAEIPVLFISALADTSDKVKAFSLGAVDYIEKPFQMEEVVARVENHLLAVKQKEQLREALEEVKAAQKQLIQSEKMASLGILSARIAHEINNPINFVYAGAAGLELDIADLLKGFDLYEKIDPKKLSPSVAEKLNRFKKKVDFPLIKKNVLTTIKDIQMGADRAADIIKRLKHFSTPDTEDKLTVNLHEEIENSVTIVDRLSKKEILFVKEFGTNVKPIQGFIGQLNQLFMNLLMNAEQAIEEKGTIKISTLNERAGVTILIEDNGCGIPEEMVDRIFEPFLTTKEMENGTGLGLSISFRIIQNHGGRISFSSQVNKGTTFKIFLPKK